MAKKVKEGLSRTMEEVETYKKNYREVWIRKFSKVKSRL